MVASEGIFQGHGYNNWLLLMHDCKSILVLMC